MVVVDDVTSPTVATDDVTGRGAVELAVCGAAFLSASCFSLSSFLLTPSVKEEDEVLASVFIPAGTHTSHLVTEVCEYRSLFGP